MLNWSCSATLRDCVSRIKEDVKLRNLNIYGQWLGIATAVLVAITNIRWLIETLVYGGVRYWFSSYRWYILPLRLADTCKIIFLPLSPITVEMPYLFSQSRWPFRVALAWFFALPILYVTEFLLGMNGGNEYLNVILPLEHSIVLWLLLMPIRRENTLMSVRARFFYYWAYTAVISLYAGHIRIGSYFMIPNDDKYIVAHNDVPGNVAAVAWICYGVAWWRGHPYVFSRALGGPGVEPMTLLISGAESRVDMVDEALEEGRIRLE